MRLAVLAIILAAAGSLSAAADEAPPPGAIAATNPIGPAVAQLAPAGACGGIIGRLRCAVRAGEEAAAGEGEGQPDDRGEADAADRCANHAPPIVNIPGCGDDDNNGGDGAPADFTPVRDADLGDIACDHGLLECPDDDDEDFWAWVEEVEAGIAAWEQELRDPDRDPFIDPGTPTGNTATTTDDDGNTVTTTLTDNGVWVTTVTDPDGNVLSTTTKVTLDDGFGNQVPVRTQTVLPGGATTRTVYDRNGQPAHRRTIPADAGPGAKTDVVFEDGVATAAKSTDGDGNATVARLEDGEPVAAVTTGGDGNTTVSRFVDGATTFEQTTDAQDRAVETYQQNDDGVVTVARTDHDKGTTTVDAVAANGTRWIETRDNRTGETVHEVGVSADGKLIRYQLGKDADLAHALGEPVATVRYESTQDFMDAAGDQEIAEFEHAGGAEFEQQLAAQQAGGDKVVGHNLTMSSEFRERSVATRVEGPGGDRETDVEKIRMRYEVRQVPGDGPIGVVSAGADPVSVDGYGQTRAEAWASALEEAGATMITNIRSETRDYIASNQTTRGGVVTDWGEVEVFEHVLDADSFVAIEDCVVDEVVAEDGGYRVRITARPGVTVRR